MQLPPLKVPFKHQTAAALYGYIRTKGYWYIEMRGGKTLSAIITAFRNNAWPALIISPKTVTPGWEDEILNYAPKGIKVVVVAGTRKMKQEQLKKDAHIFIVNKDIIAQYQILAMRYWAQIFLDESSVIGNFNSNITKAFLYSPKPANQHRYCLSGLPAPEGAWNIWPQFFWVDDCFLGYSDIKTYMDNNWYWDLETHRYQPLRYNHEQVASDYVQKHAFCRTRADLNLGGEKLRRVVRLQPSPKQLVLNDQIKITEEYTAKDGAIKEMLPITRHLFWEKIAAGIHPFTDEVFDTSKEDYILDCALEDESIPGVVVGFFTEQMRHLKKRLEDAGFKVALITGSDAETARERKDITDAFDRGEYDWVLGQITAVKMGVDFKRSDRLYIVSNSQWYDDRGQVEDRLFHATKTWPSEVIDVVIKGCVDELTRNILVNDKCSIAEAYIRNPDEMRQRVNQTLN